MVDRDEKKKPSKMQPIWTKRARFAIRLKTLLVNKYREDPGAQGNNIQSKAGISK